MFLTEGTSCVVYNADHKRDAVGRVPWHHSYPNEVILGHPELCTCTFEVRDLAQ